VNRDVVGMRLADVAGRARSLGVWGGEGLIAAGPVRKCDELVVRQETVPEGREIIVLCGPGCDLDRY